MSVTNRAQEVRKTITATCGLLAEVLATGVLHGTAEHVVQGVLAVATVFGVYTVPNAQRA